MDFNETSPVSIDTDEDGLLDGYDSSTYDNSYKPDGITIFYEESAEVYWGELNYSTHNLSATLNDYFQDSSTDPTINDSDGDGLIDGPTQGQRKGELVRDPYYHASQNCMLDPSLMDTDTDGLSDGLEVSGWDINIIWEKTKEKERTYTAYGLPARWDTSNSTFFTDFDSDGLTDFDEFQNTSDPFEKDTDGDHILDGNEGPGNATQIEGSDPEIVGDIEAEFVFVYGELLGIKVPLAMKIRVLVWVKDNAGIDWVEIECQGRNPKRIEYVPFIGGDPDRAIPVEANFQADFVGAFWSGYDIKVKVADVNGNGVSGKTHLDSVAEAVIKAILAALEAFVKAVTELASKVFDWIWGFINQIFSPIFTPITNAINRFVISISNAFIDFFKESKTANDIFNSLFGSILITLIAIILTVVDIILMIVSPIITIVIALLSQITDVITDIIIGIFGGGQSSNEPSIMGDVSYNDSDSMMSSIFIVFGMSMKITEKITPYISKIQSFIKSLSNWWQKGLKYSKSFVAVSLYLFILNIIIRTIGAVLLSGDFSNEIVTVIGICIIILASITLFYYIFKTNPIKWYWKLVKIGLILWTLFLIFSYSYQIMQRWI